ncbi:MAG: type II secretion system F family protein [archaeon]
MNLMILLIASAAVYLIYSFIEYKKSRFEEDIYNSLTIISSSLKQGNSFEAAMFTATKGNDLATGYFKKAIDKIKNGKSIEEALKESEEFSDTIILPYLTKLANVSQKSSHNVSDVLDELSLRLKAINDSKKELYERTKTNVMLIQIISIFIIPIITIFSASLLDVSVYFPIYYFMGFTAIAYGCLDFFIYGELKKTIFILPLYICAHFYAITVVAEIIISFFANII